jgi:hypothetical protein
MTDLMVTASFTLSGALGPGEPATGLTLTDIDFWLTAVDRATGATTVIWSGAQNADFEVDNVGQYGAIYSGADLDDYNYFASVRYDGITTLDQHWVNGGVGLANVPIGTAVEFTYTVLDTALDPIEGVKVEIHRDATGTDVYWVGWTDAFGVLRDTNGLKPRLDPSPPDWHLFRFKGGFTFDNPDTETVT